MAAARRKDAAAEVLHLPVLARGLPAPPPASVDPILDAAERVFARYGVRRTSVQDVADEARVNRTTVYRQVGNVESALRLLTARELHRLLAEVGIALAGRPLTPDALVAALALVIDHGRAHPVLAKVLADERPLLGAALAEYPEMLGRVAAVLVPLLEAAMDTGQLARRDPVVLAEWLTRVATTLVLAPPPGDVEAFLAELLIPALQPGR